MRRFLKILHELGSVGLMGGYLAVLILGGAALSYPPDHLASMRAGLDVVGRLLILPSLGLCLASGLLGMAVHAPYHNAPWVWMKLGTTVLVLEGTFGQVSRARAISALAEETARGVGDAAQLADLVASERGALWVLLFITAANVVLGVWRPRVRLRSAA